MLDRLITSLLDRVAQFHEHGDPDVLFEATAVAEARELRALMIRDDGPGRRSVSLTALDALAEFFLTRDRAAGSDDDDYADLGEGWRLLLLRSQVRPEGIPADFPAAFASLQEHARRASAEAQRLMHEFERTENAGTLDEAVLNYRRALNLSIAGDDVPGLPMAQLSMALLRRFQLKGEAADLDEAITLREASIASTAPDHPELARRLVLLSIMLSERHDSSGERPDLERAVSLGREAVEATPPDSHARARRLGHLATILHRRYEYSNALEDLEEAVDHAREAVEAARPDDPDLLKYVVGLTKRQRARYDRLRDPADLDAPVERLDSLLTTAPAEARTRIRTELATALFFRHERTGDLADLRRLIDLERQALDATSENDPDRGRRLVNLSVSLRVRHERLGSSDDLEEAIRLGTRAVTVQEDSGFALSSLGLAFLLRYRRTFEAADLDRAIRLATRAVDSFPAVSPHADRAMAMAHLSEALQTRLRRDFDPADLDEVIRWRREAATTVPRSHPDVGNYLSMLSQVLLSRFRYAGSAEDLAEAIRTAEEAVDVTSRTHPSYAMFVGCLAEALTTGDEVGPGALDRAVSLARDAVAAVRGNDNSLPRAWNRLGQMLRLRHEHRGGHADLREAVQCWRRAADLPIATVADRTVSCVSWGSAAVELQDHALAAEGYGRAVRLLPELAWHGLPRPTREIHLAEWSGLAPVAATCHILAGAPQRAVEVLEQGRTVIQNQLLHLRGDVSDLMRREPELAAALLRVRERLDAGRPATADPAEMPRGESLLSPLGRERLARERADLCREWDDLVARARSLQGFEHFLAPVPYAELSEAAEEGPVVVVNVSVLACHALVIRHARAPVEVVDLPDVSHDDLVRQVRAFLDVHAARRQPDRSFLRREADRHAMHDLLGLLWERIAEPVLDRLGLDGRPGTRLPRLWWCPTGPLTLLPLHAAGRYPRHRTSPGAAGADGAGSVPGRVVSSSVPTLTALRRARQREADSASFRGLLVVGMPKTPGEPPLPGVEREYRELRARFPEGTPVGGLLGAEATREAVRQALHDTSWAHFACHAEQDVQDPGQSAFVLHDDRLTAAQLLELDLPRAELAYLSACETATGAVGLPDEVMHLASTMQLAGYRHVIATMWGIHDGSAPEVAARVYAALTRTGLPDATEAARALHAAVSSHRADDPTDPLRWAAYLHVGP
ncbi:CHAT domain-containing protein [Streptomyces sp. CA-288835]|uniref:CHAT domain-containing protein n=1 Tax=Streptomyces sp. CA-288835 TaxID=3240069 RepID=UPI003D91F3EA